MFGIPDSSLLVISQATSCHQKQTQLSMIPFFTKALLAAAAHCDEIWRLCLVCPIFVNFLKNNSSSIFWKWCYPLSVQWTMTNIFSQIKFESEIFSHSKSYHKYIHIFGNCVYKRWGGLFQSTKRPQFGLFVSLRIKDNDV